MRRGIEKRDRGVVHCATTGEEKRHSLIIAKKIEEKILATPN